MRALLQRTILILLICTLLLSPSFAILQTLSDFFSLGANTVREIQEAIQLASGETQVILQELEESLSNLLDEISETYQENLDITLSSIDELTRNKILEMEDALVRVNQMIQDDIRLIGDEARSVLSEAALQARTLTEDIKNSVQDVILVAGETGVFLIDRTASNLVVIISIILLAIGLLIFIGIFFRGDDNATRLTFPRILGYIFIIGYVLLFGAIILVPQFRTFVMTSTGIGLRDTLETITKQPNVIAVIPSDIMLGETNEVDVLGSNLLVDGDSPVITIGDQTINTNAASNDRIVLNVSGLTSRDNLVTSQTLKLAYEDFEDVTAVVRLVPPPTPTPTPIPADLLVSSIRFSLSSPKTGENVRATVTIRNRGNQTATNFRVLWRPNPSHRGFLQTVSSLAPNTTRQISFNFTYNEAGSFTTTAIVDSEDRITESTENNNTRNQTIRVEERTIRLRVTFVYLDVYLDGSSGADRWSTWYRVNRTRRDVWTRQRVSDDCSEAYGRGPGGDGNACRYILNRSVLLTLNESDSLRISFGGTAHDDNDRVEISRLTFTEANNWGIGGGVRVGSRNLQRMGERYRGDTEYYVYFKVEEA